MWKCIPDPNGLGGKATLTNISVSNGDLICHMKTYSVVCLPISNDFVTNDVEKHLNIVPYFTNKQTLFLLSPFFLV